MYLLVNVVTLEVCLYLNIAFNERQLMAVLAWRIHALLYGCYIHQLMLIFVFYPGTIRCWKREREQLQYGNHIASISPGGLSS